MERDSRARTWAWRFCEKRIWPERTFREWTFRPRCCRRVIRRRRWQRSALDASFRKKKGITQRRRESRGKRALAVALRAKLGQRAARLQRSLRSLSLGQVYCDVAGV